MRLPALVLGFAALSFVALACGGGSGDNASNGAAPDESPDVTSPGGTVDGQQLINGLPSCLAPGTEVAGSAFEPEADPIAATPADQRATIKVSAVAADLYKGENNLAIGIQDLNDLPIGNAQVRLTTLPAGRHARARVPGRGRCQRARRRA